MEELLEKELLAIIDVFFYHKYHVFKNINGSFLILKAFNK